MRISRQLFWLWLVLLSGTLAGFCNTDSRRWTLVSGETFHAELVKYDPAQDVAILRINEEQEKAYSLADFSAIDAAWLLEWAQVSTDLDDVLLRMKGEFTHYQYEGEEYTSDFYVYTPSKHRETTDLPMLILFHPGGKGARYLKRFIEAAERLNLPLVCSDSFRNTKSETEAKKQQELFKDLLPAIEKTVPHDDTRLYLGGTSGGAMAAYLYSALVDRPWAGIFANGGWLGGPANYQLP